MAFSFWKALGYGVKRVRERPAEAARIWAFDAFFLIALPLLAMIVSGAWAGLGKAVSLEGLPPLRVIGVVAAFAVVILAWYCSEAAWARFLATDDKGGNIPYRLGKDELRVAGVTIVWALLLGIIGALLMIPIALVVTTMGADGGPDGSPVLFLTVLVIAAVFIFARVSAVTMLTVRRKVFRPLGLFAATDPFWFRLGLAYGIGSVLSGLLAYVIPYIAAIGSGFDANIPVMVGNGSVAPWAEWFASQAQPHAGHALIVVIAWAGAGIGQLFLRGVAAHAALNALEQEELDARGAYPASSAG